MNHKNKIYYWSPHLVNVATRRAVINSAYSVKKYSKSFECSIINFFGEFNLFKDEILNKKVNLINYFNPKILNFLPKYGKIKSRFSYLIIFILSFLPLKKEAAYAAYSVLLIKPSTRFFSKLIKNFQF